EAAFDFARLQAIEILHVLRSAERRGHQGLRFAARKERRTVRARQPTDFNRNRANFGEAAAIGTAAVVENIIAEDALLEHVEEIARFLAFCLILFRVAFDDALLEIVNRRVTLDLRLVLRVERLTQISA